jgi:hypothetical protein
MSVFDSGRCLGIEQVLSGHEEYLIASIPAALVRQVGMTIIRKEAEGMGHCEVEGNKRKSIRSDWAKASRWVVGPTPELIEKLSSP